MFLCFFWNNIEYIIVWGVLEFFDIGLFIILVLFVWCFYGFNGYYVRVYKIKYLFYYLIC